MAGAAPASLVADRIAADPASLDPAGQTMPSGASRRRPLVASLGVLALAAVGVAGWLAAVRNPASRPAPSPTLSAAPVFHGADLRGGGSVGITSFDRPTVVTFFAAWCGPCRDELPRLGAAARTHDGVDFVGVDVQDVRSEALDLVAASRVDFPAAIDPERSIADAFRVRGMPTTFFVAPGGRVVATHNGPVSASDLRVLLAKLEGAR